MDIDDPGIPNIITDEVVQVDNDGPDWVDVNESETNKTDGSGKTKSDKLLAKVVIPSHLTLSYFKYDENKASFICQLPKRSKKIRESDEVIICGVSVSSCELNGKNGSKNLGTRAGNRNRHIREVHTDVYKVKK